MKEKFKDEREMKEFTVYEESEAASMKSTRLQITFMTKMTSGRDYIG